MQMVRCLPSLTAMPAADFFASKSMVLLIDSRPWKIVGDRLLDAGFGFRLIRRVATTDKDFVFLGKPKGTGEGEAANVRAPSVE